MVWQILSAVNGAGLTIGKLKMVQLSPAEAAEHLGTADLAAGPCVPLTLVGLNSCATWTKLAADRALHPSASIAVT